jgi:hypothetical protein
MTSAIGNSTAYILRPKIDKISITFAINDEDAQKGIGSLLTNVVLDQDTPYFQNAYFKKGKAGGYAHSVHLKHPETKQTILIQAAPHYKKNRFLRLEFNPTKLGKAGMKFFREKLVDVLLFDYSYEDIIAQGQITRLDIASDIIGVTMNDILVRPTKPQVTMAFLGKTGSLESIYPSKPKPDDKSTSKVYDKKQEQLSKTVVPKYGTIPHLRVEISIKTDIKVPNLMKLKNHFSKLDILARAAVTPPEDEHHWIFFFDSCRVRGVAGALDQLPAKLREPYKMALEDAGKDFWRPEKIWSYWPKEFQKSCILDGL